MVSSKTPDSPRKDSLIGPPDLGRLQRVLPNARRLEYAKGDALLKEGSTATACYVVLKGRVQVTKKRARGEAPLKLATIKAGEFIGEMAFLSAQPRSATATAITAVRVLEIKRATFKKLIVDEGPLATELALHFASALAGRCVNLLSHLDSSAPTRQPAKTKEPIDPREVLNKVYSLWAV